jgi:hypothetical protein
MRWINKFKNTDIKTNNYENYPAIEHARKYNIRFYIESFLPSKKIMKEPFLPSTVLMKLKVIVEYFALQITFVFQKGVLQIKTVLGRTQSLFKEPFWNLFFYWCRPIPFCVRWQSVTHLHHRNTEQNTSQQSSQQKDNERYRFNVRICVIWWIGHSWSTFQIRNIPAITHSTV